MNNTGNLIVYTHGIIYWTDEDSVWVDERMPLINYHGNRRFRSCYSYNGKRFAQVNGFGQEVVGWRPKRRA